MLLLLESDLESESELDELLLCDSDRSLFSPSFSSVASGDTMFFSGFLLSSLSELECDLFKGSLSSASGLGVPDFSASSFSISSLTNGCV